MTAARFNPSLPYLSFLCINFDAPVIKEAASWFLDGVFLNYNSSYLEQMLEQLLDEDDSPEITRFLRAVDVRIDGFRVEKAPEWRGQRVFVKHEVDGKGYELRLSEESAGTQKLMGLAAFLLAALERGGTVVVDELDAKLHPKLLRYVILLFKDPEVNKSGAQLIFSSQDVSTMRNDVFRRDEIWFAARGEGEASQLWSLADIHESNGNLVSKNAAFDKQYLSGRYGADRISRALRSGISMAAKKSRDWRSGKREGRSRMVQMTRHLVVTEGKETEPRYFEGVRAALGAANERKVAVVVKGTGKHTLDLLDFAVEHCLYAPETFDHVWLVYDKDDFPASDFDAMERKCNELSDGSRTFHALWSNPCFELWPLLHFRYTTAHMSASDCQHALAQEMSKNLGIEYRKNLDGMFGAVDDRRGEALQRAGRLVAYHRELGNIKPSAQNPSTKVGEIFDVIGPYLV